jgi:hypothetical protein
VHSGHRTQKAASKEFLDRRDRSLLELKTETGGQSLPSMSAARQTAEAAFAGVPRHPTSSREAEVIVRAVRRARTAEPPPAVADTSAASQAASRAPRVFRIEGARAQAPAASARSDRPVPEAVPRSRRVASDRRPGPVLHMVQAVSPGPEATGMTVAQLKTVIAELALVEPVLELIRRAQAFRVIDDRFDREWLRLAQRADMIQGKLRARLR